MTANLVALILGAGPRVGSSVAAKLASQGYSVALVSRKGDGNKTPEGYLSLKADFAKPESIPGVFEAVKSEFKSPPSVIIYNAATVTPPAQGESIFTVPVESVISDMNVNSTTAYAAAQQAVAGWDTMPSDTKKSFIYTGNISNIKILVSPFFLTGGQGKAAAAAWIGLADELYKDKGYRFYYADERYEDGKPPYAKISGPAHGEFYSQLADHVEGVPWHATFVKDKGYVKFSSEI